MFDEIIDETKGGYRTIYVDIAATIKIEFEGKLEGAPSNSASILYNVKDFEDNREGIPSNSAANS